MEPARSKRVSHSRTGCATCRRRRVRCDGRKETCANCARLGLGCTWYPHAELSQRSRMNTACDRCRAKKVRCTSTRSTGPCEPCELAGATCISSRERDTIKSAETNTILANATEVTSYAQLPNRTELRRLLDGYFGGPHHHCFYSFIHQPTFEQMFANGQLPRSLLLIVIATSLHFMEPQNRLADTWADECRRLVMLEIFSPPSTTTLQALLLFQRYEWHRDSHISAWFVSGLAVRLAHGLQLNIEVLDGTRVPVTARETRRRLMWSCFVMESMIENGRKPLSGLNASSIEVKLPCSENAFELAVETDMPELANIYDLRYNLQPDSLGAPCALTEPSQQIGISAFLVKLASLRRNILNWTLPYHPRNKGHFPSEMPWSIESPFFHFKNELERWLMHLPEALRFGPGNMQRPRQELMSFVTLHCLFHGCYCDLFRIGSYLTASQRYGNIDNAISIPPPSFIAPCKRGRLQHALAICDVIAQSMDYQTPEYDPIVGISAALAIRVLVIERQHEDSAALNLSEEIVYERLGPAVQCGKWIAQRSVPIRSLFCSICTLARKHGLYVDLSGLSIETHSPSNATSDRVRENSPSLRTYGTFGSIQSALAARSDVNAPAASTSTDKESDLFNNIKPLHAGNQIVSTRDAQGNQEMAGIYYPTESMPPFSNDILGTGDHAIASGWGDGTLNFSIMPLQFGWVHQSLGFNFEDGGVYDSARMIW